MARKFGKKNRVKSDILSHNLALIGEAGVGKTTVIKEMLEKVGGEDSYLFLEFGKESGADEIEGIVYEDVWEWEQFEDIVDDIIANKDSDYKDLRVVVVDTFDEYMELAQQEVVRRWNIENPNDKKKMFKGTYGGFNGPYDKAIEVAFDKLWELRRCGIYFICIGHTKRRDNTDPVTDTTYSILTTNMDQRYFTALKNKVAVLGVAYVDRDIVKEKTERKNVVTKESLTKGVVKNESRVICFRSDNFSVDSKSRFANITDKIPLDADALIKALTDAVTSEQQKSGKSQEEIDKEQAEIKAKDDAVFESRLKDAKKKRENQKEEEKRSEYISKLMSDFSDASDSVKAQAKEMLYLSGCKKFTDPELPIETLKNIVSLL